MYWGHAGDSRLYLLRDNAVLVKTEDHSVVQQWVKLGKLSADDARDHPQRNQIINCLGGIEDTFFTELGEPLALRSGDVMLLVSDGLWGPFTDQELAAAFSSGNVADVMEDLIAGALQREAGHSDNITGVAVRWGDGEAAHDTAEPVSDVLEIA